MAPDGSAQKDEMAWCVSWSSNPESSTSRHIDHPHRCLAKTLNFHSENIPHHDDFELLKTCKSSAKLVCLSLPSLLVSSNIINLSSEEDHQSDSADSLPWWSPIYLCCRKTTALGWPNPGKFFICKSLI